MNLKVEDDARGWAVYTDDGQLVTFLPFGTGRDDVADLLECLESAYLTGYHEGRAQQRAEEEAQ